jgi:tetratricopeptide (TPR) repeat protein
MEMFLDQQVRADDPRMTATYANFQQNLADIIKAGRKSGAGVVVSTVAVNLRDCSPFGSSHRSGLSSDQLEKWNSYYQQGIEAQKAKAWQAADTLLRDAAAIDDTYAELRFRLGMCAIVMTNQAEAQQDFAAARDLDTLRFRCDSKLNDTIRRTVTEAQDPAVLLADAEQTFAQRTPGGIPGDDLFYEHVHLTFIGNYVLAEAIAPQIEKLLPASVAKAVPPDMTWELGAACIQRLAWDDWSFESAITSILERFRDPPFTQQLSHDTEGTYWQNLLKDLVTQYLKRGETDPVKESLKTCEAAIAAWPDDPALYEQLTALKLTGGDFPGAAEAGQRAVALRPSSSDDWSELGLALGQSGRLADAASAFQQAFALDPEDVWSRYNLAQAYEKMNRRDDAIAEYRRAVALKPRFGPAWLALGKDLAASGDKAAAESCFHLAVTNRVHQPAELNTLAQFCVSNGWFQDAVMIYDEAAQLSPGDKLLPFQSAMILKNLADVAQRNGHADAAANLGQQAAVRFGIAAQVDPDFMQAHYYYASLVADPKVSVHEFQEVVRLEPKMFQGHLNLGLALERIGSNDQAVVQYQETLKLDPSNNQAAARLQALLAKPVQ